MISGSCELLHRLLCSPFNVVVSRILSILVFNLHIYVQLSVSVENAREHGLQALEEEATDRQRAMKGESVGRPRLGLPGVIEIPAH